MGFVDRFRRRRLVQVEPDGVWLSTDAKLRALRDQASEHSASGAVVVLAHFPSTLEQLVRLFSSDHAAARPASPSELAGMLTRPQPGAVRLASARDLPTLAGEPPPEPASQLTLLVAERYPLRARDDAIVDAAQALGRQVLVRFHLCLDDPLLTRFSGMNLQSIVTTLGLGENEEITHSLVSSAIAKAQAKLARQAHADVEASSAEEWFRFAVTIEPG